jgi:hypothetical protein
MTRSSPNIFQQGNIASNTERDADRAWREAPATYREESEFIVQGATDADPIDDITNDERDSETGEGQTERVDLTGLSPDARAILALMSQMKSPSSPMPMPSSEQAPRFKGGNLRSFLDDYNMAADGARWTR